MITFITNYDESTACNYNIYERFEITPNISLLSNDATRENLTLNITASKQHVFAMSHGTENHLSAQHGDIAISEDNIINFSGVNFFSYACNTSISLGRFASDSGCTWFGYTVPINPPEPDEQLCEIYKDLFHFIIINYQNVSCRIGAINFINELKTLCDERIDILDNMSNNDDYLPGISAYQSIKQSWESISVWLANDQDPIRHSEAPQPILRW